jgi:hypothetical protein
VRDAIHRRFPQTSINKTSRACQRRLTYMLKNPTTAANVTLFYADVQQDPEVGKQSDSDSKLGRVVTETFFATYANELT